MRQPALLLAAALASQAVAATAQTITIDDLRAPTSPAFVLLDVTPSSVERPENPKSFAVNVINKLTSRSGFPQNYALEVAPYWLMSHPDLTFERYQNPGIGQSIAQTLSFSIATTPLQVATTTAASSTSTSVGTRLGAGVSVNVWNGQPNPKIEPLINDLVKIDSDIADDVISEQERPDDRTAPIKTAADKARATDTALQIQQIDAQRLGFLLTIAAGQVWNYPGDVVETAQTDRRGIWVTPAYRFRVCGDDLSCDAFVDAIGVVRALHDPGKTTMWDVGGRFLWQPNKELSISVETLRRHGAASTPDSSRTVGMLEYRMTADTSLYATFGQDFAKAVGNQPLVSLVGVNVGFGNKAMVRAQ